jgi:hypothetical protein
MSRRRNNTGGPRYRFERTRETPKRIRAALEKVARELYEIDHPEEIQERKERIQTQQKKLLTKAERKKLTTEESIITQHQETKLLYLPEPRAVQIFPIVPETEREIRYVTIRTNRFGAREYGYAARIGRTTTFNKLYEISWITDIGKRNLDQIASAIKERKESIKAHLGILVHI